MRMWFRWKSVAAKEAGTGTAFDQRAQVSRTTFYAYYSNVDEVYRELVRELMVIASTIKPQLRCSSCATCWTRSSAAA